MSKELLSKANRLNDRIEILTKNKSTLDLFNEGKREYTIGYFKFRFSGFPTDNDIEIPIGNEHIKAVINFLSHINENYLTEAKKEFEEIFNPENKNLQ